jgi:hypothetical protein
MAGRLVWLCFLILWKDLGADEKQNCDGGFSSEEADNASD